MKLDLSKIPCFGVAGNFTGHLEQAGEALDFVNIKTLDQNAPKAIFPTYIPEGKAPVPDFLTVFPFDPNKILFPKGEEKLQIESECALIFDAEWNGTKLISLKPLCFGASNDCSIRKDGAKKISQKKNWGTSTKGLSENLLPLDSFTENSLLNDYRIASFLMRGNNVYEYGENSPVSTYSYVYQKLTDWMIDKFNNQQDEGPAENISSYLNACPYKSKIMVSIGATRYTDFGENNFLQNEDISVVCLYPQSKYSPEDILSMVKQKNFTQKDISFLCQKIVL